ncbi:MAG: pantetheine-phosphate adenylyltransferase [Phycisphaeraceae bacterium]|nr:pantetheine-phosphate adenylyltransferase [Phycisphaeraceae bacterium]
MSATKRALYAGSFDPITNGHLWMIEQGANLFDELVVAIGVNPEKRATFSLTERQDMLAASLSGMERVRIDTFKSRFLVDYAGAIGAQYILRGIRSEGDYEYERGMRHVNSDLRPGITTVFLIPPREIAEVSSSLVKGLIGPEGWQPVVRSYVPEPVFRCILAKYAVPAAG